MLLDRMKFYLISRLNSWCALDSTLTDKSSSIIITGNSGCGARICYLMLQAPPSNGYNQIWTNFEMLSLKRYLGMLFWIIHLVYLAGRFFGRQGDMRGILGMFHSLGLVTCYSLQKEFRPQSGSGKTQNVFNDNEDITKVRDFDLKGGDRIVALLFWSQNTPDVKRMRKSEYANTKDRTGLDAEWVERHIPVRNFRRYSRMG